MAVRLTAPPVEGAANRACRDLLADALRVKRADVTLISGARSRDKRFLIAGLADSELHRRLCAIAGEPGDASPPDLADG